MTELSAINSSVLKSSEEHQVILEYYVKLDRCQHPKNIRELYETLKAFGSYFSDDMRRHFWLEENVFFPVALLLCSDLKFAKLVLQLQREHAAMEQAIAKLHTLAALPLDKFMAAEPQVWAALTPFLQTWKKHAWQEIEVVFPAISDHPEKSAILDKLLESLNQVKP